MMILMSLACARGCVYICPWARVNFRSSGGSKGYPIFQLTGCLWVMEIPGLSSKNAAISLFWRSIQTTLSHFCHISLTHIFMGWSIER